MSCRSAARPTSMPTADAVTDDAALDWSHDALTPEERVVFRRLGVFAGGFSVEAAAEVVDAAELDVDPFEVLASLADKHLLRVGRDGGRILPLRS